MTLGVQYDVSAFIFQVCSSSFVDETWIKASYGANSSNIWPMDARTVVSSYAQFLRSFCRLSRLSLETTILDSIGSVMISPEALFETLLQLKVKDQIDLIRLTGPWMLTASVVVTRLSANGNEYISGLGTNAMAYMSPHTIDTALIDSNIYEIGSDLICQCSPMSTCQIPAAIYSNPVEPTANVYHLNMNKTLIQGMQTACLPLEGFLASTLECYFNLSCLQLLVSNFTDFIPLNSTAPSRYSPNTTMEEIINNLLIEEWFYHYSSEDYFKQCAPLICSYSYTHYNTLLTIITSITGIVSGVIIILRIIVPWFVRYLFKLKKKLVRSTTNSVQPVDTSVETTTKSGRLHIKTK